MIVTRYGCRAGPMWSITTADAATGGSPAALRPMRAPVVVAGDIDTS